MHKFIIFMGINQVDDDIDYKLLCEKPVEIFFNKNIARERTDKKDSRNFAILDYWKLWLFKNETK